MCTPYLTQNMGLGSRGPEVVKLQQFLNKYENANLPVTGYFGTMTHDAVMAFQQKFTGQILTPLSLTKPTGFAGKMTRGEIDELVCDNP